MTTPAPFVLTDPDSGEQVATVAQLNDWIDRAQAQADTESDRGPRRVSALAAAPRRRLRR